MNSIIAIPLIAALVLASVCVLFMAIAMYSIKTWTVAPDDYLPDMQQFGS